MATIPLLPVTGCAGSRAFRRPVDPSYIERETHRRVSIFSRIYGGTARKHEEEVARKAAGRCTRFRSPDSSLFWRKESGRRHACTRVPFRSRTKEGRKVRCRRRRSPARQGCVLSWRPHRCRDLDVVQSCDSPPVYTIYNRTRFHGKEISADSLSRERKLMQRFIFDTRIVREQYTSICQFVGSILKKDSKGNIWLVNICSRRDNVIDSRLKHRRQNTFVT